LALVSGRHAGVYDGHSRGRCGRGLVDEDEPADTGRGDGEFPFPKPPVRSDWVHPVCNSPLFQVHYRIVSLTIKDQLRAPLSGPKADLYVAQSAVVATRLGVIDPPTTVAGLDASLESYRPELAGTPAARDAARFLLLHPRVPAAGGAGYGALSAGAVALLPRWARQHLGLPTLPLAERAIALSLGAAATGVIRWALQAPREPPH